MNGGKRRQFCGHCEEYLVTLAFKKHKDLYYDATTKKWTKKEDTLTSKPGAKDEYDEQIIAGIYVTRSEKSRLPRTQQQDTLFTIKQ